MDNKDKETEKLDDEKLEAVTGGAKRDGRPDPNAVYIEPDLTAL